MRRGSRASPHRGDGRGVPREHPPAERGEAAGDLRGVRLGRDVSCGDGVLPATAGRRRISRAEVRADLAKARDLRHGTLALIQFAIVREKPSTKASGRVAYSGGAPVTASWNRWLAVGN